MLITINIILDDEDKFVIDIDDSEYIGDLIDRIVLSGPYITKDNVYIFDKEDNTTLNYGSSLKNYDIRDCDTLHMYHTAECQ